MAPSRVFLFFRSLSPEGSKVKEVRKLYLVGFKRLSRKGSRTGLEITLSKGHIFHCRADLFIPDLIDDVREGFQVVQAPVGVVVLNRLVHPPQYRSYLRRVVAGVPDQGVDGVPE